MGLFDLEMPSEAATCAPKQQSDYVVKIKTTRSGRSILVCTAPVAPPQVITDAQKAGLPLFTGIEINNMRDCHPEMVDHILATKLTFPGCTVQQIINGEVTP